MATFSVTAQLDRHEVQTIRAIIASINIGVPVDDKPDEKAQRTDENYQLRRALNSLVGGDAVSMSTLQRAIKAVDMQITACRIESDVNHWLDQLPAAERDMDATSLSIATKMSTALAEARVGQLSDAQRALNILTEISSQIDAAMMRLPRVSDGAYA